MSDFSEWPTPAKGLLILFGEAIAIHLPWLRESPELYGPNVRARLEASALIPAADYLDAVRARPKVVRRILRSLSSVDMVVSPTVPVAAPAIDATAPAGDGAVDPRAVLLRNTRLADVTGQPTASVPCGFTSAGLPVGMQISGMPWQDNLVLRVAHAYQQVSDWHRRRPVISG